MAAPGPHSCWQRYALALVAAMCLTGAAAGAAAADSSKPTASPLWKAYPLDDGPTAAAASTTTPEREAAPLPQLRADSARASMPVQIVFFAGLGGVLLLAVRAVVVCMARRRRADLKRMGAL
jgi:hypothetical protein